MARLLCPWDSLGKNTGVGCYFFLQGIFPTQGSNPGLLCLPRWQAGSWPPAPLLLLSPVQLSRSVMSNSLRPRGLQHTRPPCPSPAPGVYSHLMSIESVMPSNHLILFRSPLLPPSIFPSIRVFSNESALCIKYWSFSFSISPYNEYSGLISFRMDMLALQLSNMQY